MTYMPVFVFGSNEGGFHGAGAAKYALKYRGAKLYQAEGRQGNSYAIPTKDRTIQRTLSVKAIKEYVDRFIGYASVSTEEFQVTRIGCGLAMLADEDIAPLFRDAPNNCSFDLAWKPFLDDKPRKYWGTF